MTSLKKLKINAQNQTPYFVFSEEKIINNAFFLKQLKSTSPFTLLYSVKALSSSSILEKLSDEIDGFSVSSLFEAKLSRKFSNKIIHYVSPLIKPDELQEVSKLCDRITFNSLTQLEAFKHVSNVASIGLRLNPEISFLEDEKYNPCRLYSKLGVPISKINKDIFKTIKGLHLHSNCDSSDLSQLIKIIHDIEKKIGNDLHKIDWLNLGGGYIFNKQTTGIDLFLKTISRLRSKYSIEIIIEPGKSFIEDAVTLVSSVYDIIERDNKKIAILDTCINHLPEVFEYQYKPDILEEDEDGDFNYILAGRTCLAGDLFGEFSFKNKLKIGESRITFKNIGSYSIVKSHMFNGVNLPSIYLLDKNKKLHKIKDYSFEDYLQLTKTK